MKVNKNKIYVWSLTKPIPPSYKSFIKAHTIESSKSPLPKQLLEFNGDYITYLQGLFMELQKCTSDRDVQFICPDAQLNN